MHFSHKLIFLVLLIPLCAGGTENQTDKKYLDSALRREGNPENGKKIFKDKARTRLGVAIRLEVLG